MNRMIVLLLLLVMPLSAFAQQPKPDNKPEAAKAAKKEALQPNPLLLTDSEQRELTEAISFINQAKKEYEAALDDALNVPIERLNALEVLGRMQKSNTTLRAANQHLIDLKEKHKATRPDCEKCQYSPDARSLVRLGEGK